MPERISPWVRDQAHRWQVDCTGPLPLPSGKFKTHDWHRFRTWLCLSVNNTVKGLQMVLHQLVIPSDTFSDQGHHLRVHFVQYRPNT